MTFIENIIILVAINAIAAIGVNFITSYCGISLSHAAFFAIGGYVYALCTKLLNWEFYSAVMLAMLVSVLFSCSLSLLAWRLKDDAFVLATLALQAIIYSICYNWATPETPLGSLLNLTGGPYGIQGIQAPNIFGFKLQSTTSIALFYLAIVSGIAFLGHLSLRSPWGRLLTAMHDDELLARSLGKNVRLLKFQTCALGCALLALAGACYAAFIKVIDPEIAALEQSIYLLLIVLIGGPGNVIGSLVGALLVGATPEVLRLLEIPSQKAPVLRLLIFGIVLLVITHLRPRGLMGRFSA